MGSRELFGIACVSSLTINRWHFKVLMFIYLEEKLCLQDWFLQTVCGWPLIPFGANFLQQQLKVTQTRKIGVTGSPNKEQDNSFKCWKTQMTLVLVCAFDFRGSCASFTNQL